ncbi:hypothetical protein IKD98_01265 [Candidatus Saccharibacteria bacterium]|nr:hypothetical protein [Candidatus Saccharibacteria bacterium]
MLKVLVFDSGFGGELFADKLEEELPVVEVIRIIDWRNAKKLQNNPIKSRAIIKKDLKSYINKVDLIVFANHFLSITNLNYFKRKYRKQMFLGMKLKKPDSFIKRDVLILTTSAVARTLSFHKFVYCLKRKSISLPLDTWPDKIDDGELTIEEIQESIDSVVKKSKLHPKEIVLGCAQFNDIKNELRQVFGPNIRIYDSFDETLRRVVKTLHIRGGIAKR